MDGDAENRSIFSQVKVNRFVGKDLEVEDQKKAAHTSGGGSFTKVQTIENEKLLSMLL